MTGQVISQQDIVSRGSTRETTEGDHQQTCFVSCTCICFL